MKKICLVARQNIYKDSTHLHDDNGLRALNGIKYGKVHEIEDNEDPLNIWHSLRLEFKKENPTFHADRYSIRFEDGHEIECNDRMTMHTPNLADENFKKLAALFPNAVTETVDADGKVVRAIDKDVLMQEISTTVVEGREERYQFTWPDKKKAMLTANAPISATLRPVKADSVGKDGTPGGWDSENLYIEGDNLDVLKLLRETYLGKVKMIYIDPPYNTGNDFVYEDDFAEDTDSYMGRSGQYDEQGNQLVQNTDSNGRFHTDWLNMIYPRLRVAKDLLTEDGVIFISIDDGEIENLKKMCDEVFGDKNFLAQISIVTGANQSGEGVLIQKNVEYCLVYTKSILNVKINRVDKTEESYRNLNDAPTALETRLDMGYTIYYNESTNQMVPINDCDKSKIYTNDENQVYKNSAELIKKGFIPVRPGKRNGKLHRWRWGIDTFLERKSEVTMFKNGDKYTPKFLQSGFNAPKNIWNFTAGTIGLKKLFGVSVFDYSKSEKLLAYITAIGGDTDSIILDFFSGSATTAHAVMLLNAEDGGHRKFIMVQLPEATDEKSEAYKAGYKNICEIGKERIRRAGAKIKEENPEKAQNLDTGFRVLKLDSSNMKDVFYSPKETSQLELFRYVDNVKDDRTSEDLLFQVMLELGATLDSKIEESEVDGKTIYNVADGYLVACFDQDVSDDVVKAIAKMQPTYAVLRDTGMADDATATNFEQIFKTYAPNTTARIL